MKVLLVLVLAVIIAVLANGRNGSVAKSKNDS
jgi:hypothetical protein